MYVIIITRSAIISQCITVSKQHAICLKLTQCRTLNLFNRKKKKTYR